MSISRRTFLERWLYPFREIRVKCGLHGEGRGKVGFKTLGLVALATLAAIVLVRSPSWAAASIALCDSDAGGGTHGQCPSGHRLRHLHEASVGKAALLTSIFSVECSALFLGDVLSPNGSAASLWIEGSFTYSNCTEGCILTEETVPTELIVERQGSRIVNRIGYDLLHVNCSGFSNCTYKKPSTYGVRRDPSSSKQPNGEMTFYRQVTRKESGALCLDSARLDLVTTPLQPAYITD